MSNKINDIIKNHQKHSSICNITTKHAGNRTFSFRPVSVEEVKKIVRDFKTEYLMESILVPILLNLD